MIEITAKQLYDIYDEFMMPEFFDGSSTSDYTASVELSDGTVRNIVFIIDKSNGHPYTWKPTTDLIIKA